MELEGKMRKRLSDCQGMDYSEGEHLEKSYLLLDMRDLGNLIDGVKRAKHGEGYRTTVHTSTGATLYLLVYGTEDVILAEVEIPSLRIIQEAELSNAKWVRSRYEQLALIDGKIMNMVSHGQLYLNRMARAFNKKVRSRKFTSGQLVLKRIFPHQNEAKGKFSPNWKGPYMVHRVLTGGAFILAEMDGEIWPKPINSDTIKRYYV
ncbi:uncharacterized protein [Nicotiana tomentosiformis]|uniref:uncharacterized protein n=1 Tax=Nicotiana tomentosiformis TaxID=4098 RepID=UPI00388CE04D